MSPIIENCRLIICKDCQDVGTKLWNSARPRLCVARLRLRHGRAAAEMRRNLSRIAAAAAHRPRQLKWRTEEANILLHAEATSHIWVHRHEKKWQLISAMANPLSNFLKPFGIWLADSRHRSAYLVGCRLATIFRRSIVLVPKSVCLCQFLPPFWPHIKGKVNALL